MSNRSKEQQVIDAKRIELAGTRNLWGHTLLTADLGDGITVMVQKVRNGKRRGFVWVISVDGEGVRKVRRSIHVGGERKVSDIFASIRRDVAALR